MKIYVLSYLVFMNKKVPKKLKLSVKWSDKEDDFVISYPRSSDGHFIHCHLMSKQIISSTIKDPEEFTTLREKASWNGNFGYFDFDWLKALKSRGFDLKTFKFEITIDKDVFQEKFSHIWKDLTEKEKESVLALGFKKPKL